MNILKKGKSINHFFDRLRQAQKRGLFLDYDGTLAPFSIDRYKAFPYPGVKDILEKIISSGHTHVAIISGRWIKDLKPLLGIEGNLEIWGSHGLERMKEDGSYELTKFDDAALRGLAEADSWINAQGYGDFCEQKPGCLAIHWRGLQQNKIEEIRSKCFSDLICRIAGKHLEIKEFNGGVELHVIGPNKGDAVKTLLHEMGPETVTAYLGDDKTDEDAFNALNDLGASLLVRNECKETVADFWIKPPEELIEFLVQWDTTCRMTT